MTFQRHLVFGSALAMIFAAFLATVGGIYLLADDVQPDAPVLVAPQPVLPSLPSLATTERDPAIPSYQLMRPQTPATSPPGPSDSEIHQLPYSRPPQPHVAVPVLPNDNPPSPYRMRAPSTPNRPVPVQPKPQLRDARPPQVAAPASRSKPITMSLLHVEIEMPLNSDLDLKEQIRQSLATDQPLELPTGKVQTAKRMSFTGVTDIECYCQFGEEKAKITQARIDERTGSQTNSFQMIPVGTILTVTARQTDDDSFVLECDYESSRLAPEDEGLVIAQDGEQAVRTSDVDQFRVRTTVAIKSGEPIILSGTNQITKDEKTIQTLVALLLTTP